MGLAIRKFTQNCASITNVLNRDYSRKRKRNEADDLSSNGDKANESVFPKKQKILTTTQYMYQKLFKEQKDSDITILALGKTWKLHKMYLSQSPYFYSMFNRSWRESYANFVHIKIIDNRINLDSLDAVFSSMYSDEIYIETENCINILATATFFHLDGIINKCAEVMNDAIDAQTVIQYYEIACQYGCQQVRKAAFNWLEINLLNIYNQYPDLLRSISIELMTDIISSPDLYVMQTEFSLYVLLRTWIYLRLHPNYKPTTTYKIQSKDDESKQSEKSNQNSLLNLKINTLQQAPELSLTVLIYRYFSEAKSNTYQGEAQLQYYNERHSNGCNCCFLCKPEGRQFLKPFQALRTQYLTNQYIDLQILLNDNIIPKEWIYKHILQHWQYILKVDQLVMEEGVRNVDAETFQKYAMRCGRILLDSGYSKWRWTGFHFGIDLIIVVDNRVLSIRRQHCREYERLLTLQLKRRFMIKIHVTSINSQRQPIYTQKLDITHLCMEKNEQISLMHMQPELVHPLLISVNFLILPPQDQQFKQRINISDEN